MVSQTEEEDFDPSKNPTYLLFRHITLKGIQLGSLVGCGAVLPLLAIRGYLRGSSFNTLSAAKALTYSTFGGVIASDGFGMYKYLGMDQEGLEDRVYRLHYNTGQNRSDLFTLVGGIISAAPVPMFLSRSPFMVLGAFTVGSAVGTMAHAFTWKEEGSGVDKMLHEVKNT